MEGIDFVQAGSLAVVVAVLSAGGVRFMKEIRKMYNGQADDRERRERERFDKMMDMSRKHQGEIMGALRTIGGILAREKVRDEGE